jgi:CHAT domain-containing protein/tetratricopeptide (TPR) repeat protein
MRIPSFRPLLACFLPFLIVGAGSFPTNAFAQAQQPAEQAPAEPSDPEIDESTALSAKVTELYNAGKFTEARPLAERALEIRERKLPADHPYVSEALSNLALILQEFGEYAKAESFMLRALPIDEKAFGADHPYVAIDVNNLGNLYRERGDFVKAEPLYQRALAIQEKQTGAESAETGIFVSNLAALYFDKGDFAQSEALFKRGLGIIEKAQGADSTSAAVSLNNLAMVYTSGTGEYAKAEPLYQRALALFEKASGPTGTQTASALNNLGSLYEKMGDLAKAEPLYERALAIYEKAFGPEHQLVSRTLNNLAGLYRAKGDLVKAEAYFTRAIAIVGKAYGPRHPNIATTENSLASVLLAKGDVAGAVARQSHANEVSEQNIALTIATGSERQKYLYLQTYLGETNRTISLHTIGAPKDPAALNLSVTTILRRKGRSLEAMADSIGALRRRATPEDAALLDALGRERAQLAKLLLKGPGSTPVAAYQAEVKSREAQVEKLEVDISRRSAEFRALSQPTTLDAVRAALPPSTVLVEFVRYFATDVKVQKTLPSRYVAYVISKTGEPAWVELGEASTIDDLVKAFRDQLRTPEGADVKTIARLLDQAVMAPIRPLLGAVEHVFVSPDSELNLIPFGALVDEKDHYLVERYEFTYLTSGRDLLRLQVRAEAAGQPVIVAAPDFGVKPAGASTREPTGTLAGVSFPALPGTALEAEALRAMLPDAKVLTGAAATEAAVKSVHRPRILHVATHGFFLPDPGSRSPDSRSQNPGSGFENPLIRSGLAFAGANTRTSDDDGVLTALEAAGLDLWGTQLVVLSACDTGVGEVRTGDGVYGLRRAIVLAGAESQVMSLWPASDAATRDLMEGYYKRVLDGDGRSAALRSVQLKMLESKKRGHPFYWATFIPEGAWTGIVPAKSSK